MTTSSKTTLVTPAILLTSLSVGFYWVSMYLYVPTLPVYAQTKTANLALIGTVLAQYGLWQAIVRFPLGILSDWLGRRRPFIFLGFLLAGLGAWLMGSAASIQGLLVGRAVTGLAAASWVIMVVAFSSLFPAREAVRASAIISLINSASIMLATTFTGVLNNLGGYSLAFTLAALAAGLAVLVYLPVKEVRLERKSQSVQAIGRLVTRKDVLLPSELNTLAQYTNFATTFGFIPILARQFGASNITQSLLVSMNLALGITGNLLTTTLVRRFGARRLVLSGFLAMVLGIVLLWRAQSLAWIFPAQLLLGLGFGLAYPALMGKSIEQVDSAQRSTAMGLHQALYGIGMFAGPWLSGILAKSIGVQPMFGVTAAGVLILALLGTRKLE
jgi:MFS family permease